jgi:hypothetical protein
MRSFLIEEEKYRFNLLLKLTRCKDLSIVLVKVMFMFSEGSVLKDEENKSVGDIHKIKRHYLIKWWGKPAVSSCCDLFN